MATTTTTTTTKTKQNIDPRGVANGNTCQRGKKKLI
jgi:hypothetical protein